jgi:hypothetical protein
MISSDDTHHLNMLLLSLSNLGIQENVSSHDNALELSCVTL